MVGRRPPTVDGRARAEGSAERFACRLRHPDPDSWRSRFAAGQRADSTAFRVRVSVCGTPTEGMPALECIVATSEKRRTTIYMSRDVLEYLGIRRAKGAGSVSQQLEDLVREIMPRRLGDEAVEALEAKDVEGYRAKPQTDDELEPWLAEQVRPET